VRAALSERTGPHGAQLILELAAELRGLDDNTTYMAELSAFSRGSRHNYTATAVQKRARVRAQGLIGRANTTAKLWHFAFHFFSILSNDTTKIPMPLHASKKGK
jgi:hypothetical protein